MTVLARSLPASASAASRSRGASPRAKLKIKRRDLTFILRNLATLLDNGLPLARSLATLTQEKALKKYSGFLDDARKQVEAGALFSAALGEFPTIFPPVMVHQIRVGEKSGTLPATLGRVAEQFENGDRVRSLALRKLAYPAVLLIGGGVAVSFMLLFVVPIFQETYDEAGVQLPWVTRFLIGAADWAKSWGWLIPLGLVALVIGVKRARRNPATGPTVDGWFLRLPLLGDWLRNICVLQFMEVLGNLLESGFTVAEALNISSGAIGNQAVSRSVQSLQSAVNRGERFSRELDRLGELFPPVVTQLVVVGERTGSLTKTTLHIRDHLRREIERQTMMLVGILEPVLTISLAVMIGVILLAIYLPMFDMIGALNAH